MNERPIGIFDSGVGGTSIWKEINSLLPFEDTIFLADSKNAPYGEKSKEQIVRLCVKNTDLLLRNNCKLIVVACNTATTNAIDYLRKNYKVPFIGIEPAIKPAALKSKSKTVGVLATKGTLSSALFHSTSENHANGIAIIERIGTGLVPLIESGHVNTPEVKVLLKKYLDPMVAAGIDYLVLGCTHYPYLVSAIKELLPEGIKIIDSGEAVARQTKAILDQNNLRARSTKEGISRFFTNGDVHTLEHFLTDLKKPHEVQYLDF